MPDPTFPAVELTAPIVSPMGILPLQDGGALVISSSSTGFSLRDGQPSIPLLRLGPTGSVVNRQWAGSSAALIANDSSFASPVWVQLVSGNVLAVSSLSVVPSTAISLVQIALNGTVDFSLSLAVTAPAGGFGASIAGLWRLADGSVIVAGQFSAIGGHATQNLAHLSASGSVDLTYTCQLPLCGPYDVGSDGTLFGVNPAPSNSLTGLPTLTRLAASAAVTDTWSFPALPGSSFVALESSGSVLLAINPPGYWVAVPTIGMTAAPIVATIPILYRFTRGTANPTTLFTGSSNSPLTATFTGLDVLADGSIILIGGPTGLYPSQTSGLVHLSASGVVDTSFSLSALNGETAERLSRGPNSWFIESKSASPLMQRWREFSADFSTQLTFDPDLRTGATASAGVPLPDNSILWQGSFVNPSRTIQSFVRSGPDGTLDYAHVPLTPEAASSRVAAVGADGSIYLIAASPIVTPRRAKLPARWGQRAPPSETPCLQRDRPPLPPARSGPRSSNAIRATAVGTRRSAGPASPVPIARSTP